MVLCLCLGEKKNNALNFTGIALKLHWNLKTADTVGVTLKHEWFAFSPAFKLNLILRTIHTYSISQVFIHVQVYKKIIPQCG